MEGAVRRERAQGRCFLIELAVTPKPVIIHTILFQPQCRPFLSPGSVGVNLLSSVESHCYIWLEPARVSRIASDEGPRRAEVVPFDALEGGGFRYPFTAGSTKVPP